LLRLFEFSLQTNDLSALPFRKALAQIRTGGLGSRTRIVQQIKVACQVSAIDPGEHCRQIRQPLAHLEPVPDSPRLVARAKRRSVVWTDASHIRKVKPTRS
jgi:hypothetical protein